MGVAAAQAGPAAARSGNGAGDLYCWLCLSGRMNAMKANPLSALVLVLLVTCWPAPATAAAPTHEFRGVSFEDAVSQANGKVLALKGLSEIDHNYLPLYAAAFFVAKDKPDLRDLADGQLPCRIELRWLISS